MSNEHSPHFRKGEIGFSAPDLAAELAFWERLGFHRLERASANPTEHVHLTDGRVLIGLYAMEFPSPTAGFYVADPEGAVAQLEAGGLDVNVTRREDGSFEAAEATTPNGLPLLLLPTSELAYPERSEEPGSLAGVMAELAIWVKDLPEAVAFWETIGFPRIGGSLDGPMPYAIMGSMDFPVGLHFHEQMDSGQAPTFFHAEQKKLIGQLRAEGVPIPWEMAGESGEIEHVWVTTPNGHTLYLFTGEIPLE